MQEKEGSHQIQALIGELLSQKLGAHPPFGQPGNARKGGVLLLEPDSGRGARRAAMRSKLLGARTVPKAHSYPHPMLGLSLLSQVLLGHRRLTLLALL